MKKIRPTAPSVLPTTLAAALAAALSVGLAACGPSGSSSVASSSSSSSPAGTASAGSSATTSAPAATDPLADQSARAIITKALAGTAAASSVHFAGTVSDSGEKTTLALTVAKGKGCTGSIGQQKSGSMQVISIGKTMWIKADATFWKSSIGGSDGSLAASLLQDKWLKASASDSTGLGSMTTLCALGSLIDQAVPAGDHLAKGAPTTLNGQPVVPITDSTQPGTAYVTDTAQPELVRFTQSGSEGGTLDFSGYGAPVTITPPPASEVVDGSKYGF